MLFLGLRGRDVVGLLWTERITGERTAEVHPSDRMDIIEAGLDAGGAIPARRSGCASIGVALVWVRRAERRRGLATALVDVARQRGAYVGLPPIPLEQVAFTQPTQQGLNFAARYAGAVRGGNVLVYRPSWA